MVQRWSLRLSYLYLQLVLLNGPVGIQSIKKALPIDPSMVPPVQKCVRKNGYAIVTLSPPLAVMSDQGKDLQ
ncbi:hypothetical protein BO82DRAFT_351628 [Aspergillus uvarum CBS 121591]|uniref:Uncharacterized protein n=1 Tax=Aspergillus uvarum CBS 121591 TaxID=1448315 RepID=A0A319DA11_9EURO|nr:hypothetical protein BO82DRAFT_351628 [Aspergillus uvarum CBS 121591]PYH84828.1 hypothetical protein BO82DRAFT_351628 [Aspergillus uvarum CBS 121591]